MKRHQFLLVDDDPGVRSRVRALLLEEYPFAGFFEAGSADEAVGMASTCAPTMIVIDCHMPGRSGIKALPDLRSRQPSIPIVMLSGEAADTYRPYALRAGATAFVSKDAGLDDLMYVVRRVTAPGEVSAVA